MQTFKFLAVFLMKCWWILFVQSLGKVEANLSASCGGVIENSDHGTIESPNYPVRYPSNATCVWLIKAPHQYDVIELSFVDVQLEKATFCEYDFIEITYISNGSHPKLCSDVIDTVTSFNSSVLIRFVSDASFEEAGFRIIYKVMRRIILSTNSTFVPTEESSDLVSTTTRVQQRTLTSTYDSTAESKLRISTTLSTLIDRISTEKASHFTQRLENKPYFQQTWVKTFPCSDPELSPLNCVATKKRAPVSKLGIICFLVFSSIASALFIIFAVLLILQKRNPLPEISRKKSTKALMKITEETPITYDSIAATTKPMKRSDYSHKHDGDQEIIENDQFTFWETLIDPKKLFPTLDPLAGVIVYIAIILLFVLFLLLLIWIITAWCLDCKARRKKRRYRNHLLAHDLYSRSMSSLGSVGSLSTVTSSTYGNSLSKLVKSEKKAKKLRRPKSQSSQPAHLRPLSCGAARCPSCTSFDMMDNRRKQLKRAKSHTEKSQLLRNHSLYQPSHTTFLQRNPSYLSSTSSFANNLCQNCYTETCFDKSCELPRANWSGENIVNFIRDHAVKPKPETPAPDYGSVVEGFQPSPEAKSDSPTFKANVAEFGSLDGVENYGYTADLPLPPTTKS